MAGKVYVGDVGTEIILDCMTDISGATTTEIVAQKPNGSRVTWPAQIVESTKLKYVTIQGDLSHPGLWKLQARVVLPDWSGRGETFEVRIYNLFE